MLNVGAWSNIAKAQDRFGKKVIKDSRQNLSIKRKRKSGSGRTITSSINSTGTLTKSMRYKRKNLNITFSMADYGYYVDQGRKPGTFPPVSAIRKWIKDKPVKPRDERGRFVRQTQSTMNSLAFLLGRSIKRFGIKKTRFFSEPFEQHFRKLDEEVGMAILDDLDILFKK